MRKETQRWIGFKKGRYHVPFSSSLLMVSFTSFQASIHYISTHSDLSRVNGGTSFSLSRPYPNSIARFAKKYIYSVNWLPGKTESRGLFEPSRQCSWSQCLSWWPSSTGGSTTTPQGHGIPLWLPCPCGVATRQTVI